MSLRTVGDLLFGTHHILRRGIHGLGKGEGNIDMGNPLEFERVKGILGLERDIIDTMCNDIH